MSCNFIEITDCIEEGNSITIGYNLTDSNGVSITSVDKLEYSLSDGDSMLIPWTEIVTPDLPTGEIEIPGIKNRVTNLIDRYLAIRANYDTGSKDAFKTVRYQLINSPNTTVALPI